MRRLQVILVILLLALVSCGPTPTPRVIRETVVVEVTRLVEQQVTVLVTQPPLATHTPGPPPTLEVIREPTAIKASPIATKTTIPVLTSTSTPAPTSMPEQTIAMDARASAYVCGNASPDLPAGEPGKISVVASRMRSNLGWGSTTIELLLRNNTTKPVTSISVSAAAYSADGKLFAIGGDQGFSPKYTAPGEIAMGYVYFGNAELPQDARVEYEATARNISPGEEQGDLEVVDCNLVENRIMGILKNTGNRTVTGPVEAVACCFDENGNLLGYYSDYTKKDQAEPGGSIPFEVSLGGDVCPLYLVAGSGYVW